MYLNVMVTAGGEVVRGVGFEFDQVLGGFGPEALQPGECKPYQTGWSRKGFRLREHDQRHPAQRNSILVAETAEAGRVALLRLFPTAIGAAMRGSPNSQCTSLGITVAAGSGRRC